ncbi:MAG: DUF2076 family protein [Anaerolineae bacterium]|nr:DUF2076 family protein [Anaerolineae bacterium]
MQHEEKQLIDALFRKIDQIAAQSGPRDSQAEALINQHVHRIPGAMYYLAQATIIQYQALKQAEVRIAELERQTRGQGQAGQSFLPGRQSSPVTQTPSVASHQSGGGGFLAGAAKSALGIGGGILIANAATSLIDGIFGGGYRAGDLFDAYEAGAEDALIDDAIFEAGYDEAVTDIGDELFSADLLGDDDDWDDD